MLGKEPGQNHDDRGRRQGSADLDGQTLACEVVANTQYLEPGSTLGRIEEKVQGPDLLGALCLDLGLGRSSRLTFSSSTAAHQEPLFSPQALHSFVVEGLAFLPQSLVGFAKAPARVLLGEGTQRLAQFGIAVRAGLVLERGPVQPRQTTGVALGEAKIDQKDDQFSLPCQTGYFFARNSLSASISNSLSASSFLSRAFSFSSSLSRWASGMLIPPNCLRQR